MLFRRILTFNRSLFHGQHSLRNATNVAAVSLTYNSFGKRSDDAHAPLVIGHGLFGHKANWNSIAKRLQHRLANQVFVVDLRNHGESPHVADMTFPHMAADYANFIENVVLPMTSFDRVHLLGHSMGGKAAALFALNPKHAQLLKSVIVEDVSPVSASRNIHFRHYISNMKTVNLKQSRRAIGDDLAHVVTNSAVRQFLLTNLMPVAEGNHQEFRWKMNLSAIEAHVEDVFRFVVTKGNFLGPSLFVYGENSGYLKPEDFKAIRRLFPTVNFTGVPNAGHWVHAEQPETFMNAIVDFIVSVDHRD